MIQEKGEYKISYDKVFEITRGTCNGLNLWKVFLEHIQETELIELDFREQIFNVSKRKNCF